MHSVKLLCVIQNEEQPKAKDTHDVSCQREQEQEEVAVIPSAYAVVHPRTMVIKILQDDMEDGRKRACIWKNTNIQGLRNNHCRMLLPNQVGQNGQMTTESSVLKPIRWDRLIPLAQTGSRLRLATTLYLCVLGCVYTSTQLSHTEQCEQRGGL